MKLTSAADDKLRSRRKEAGADDNADLMKGERGIPNPNAPTSVPGNIGRVPNP